MINPMMLSVVTDLLQANLYSYKLSFDEGCPYIDLPHATIHIEKRNFYCDRGRYGFWVEVKPEHRDKLTVDAADKFPRYFFNLQRAIDEMHDWVLFNQKKLYPEQNEERTEP